MTQPVAPVSPAAAGRSIDTRRLATAENLDQAGQQFEAIFVNMMLGAMRKARLSEGLFESQALDQFRDMQDQQLAKSMAASTPLGIGKAMTEFLSRSHPVAADPAPAAPAVPGASDDMQVTR